MLPRQQVGADHCHLLAGEGHNASQRDRSCEFDVVAEIRRSMAAERSSKHAEMAWSYRRSRHRKRGRILVKASGGASVRRAARSAAI